MTCHISIILDDTLRVSHELYQQSLANEAEHKKTLNIDTTFTSLRLCVFGYWLLLFFFLSASRLAREVSFAFIQRSALCITMHRCSFYHFHCGFAVLVCLLITWVLTRPLVLSRFHSGVLGCMRACICIHLITLNSRVLDSSVLCEINVNAKYAALVVTLTKHKVNIACLLTWQIISSWHTCTNKSKCLPPAPTAHRASSAIRVQWSRWLKWHPACMIIKSIKSSVLSTAWIVSRLSSSSVAYVLATIMHACNWASSLCNHFSFLRNCVHYETGMKKENEKLKWLALFYLVVILL